MQLREGYKKKKSRKKQVITQMYLIDESPSLDLEMMQSGVGVQLNGRALTQSRQGLGPPHHHTHLHTQTHPPMRTVLGKDFQFIIWKQIFLFKQ